MDHPDWPENPKKFVRIDVRLHGVVFEDNPAVNGCSMKSYVENDAKMSVPALLLNSIVKKSTTKMIENLSKACKKIMAGKKP